MQCLHFPALQNRSPDRLRHRQRMHHDGFDAADHPVRLVENAELMQHCGAVVINLLARQPILGVEGETPHSGNCTGRPVGGSPRHAPR